MVKKSSKPGSGSKRLAPTKDVLRRLYAVSGNICAFPGCPHLLINRSGALIGQVCHIEAAEKGGERYREDMSNEERRAFPNLILLCYEHHVETNDVDIFTVEKMQKIKLDHENKFSSPESILMQYFKDWSQDEGFTSPVTYSKAKAFDTQNFDDEDFMSELKTFMINLRHTPIKVRYFLTSFANRAHELIKIRHLVDSNNKVKIPIVSLMEISRLGSSQLKSLIEQSMQAKLAEVDNDDKAEFVLLNWWIWSTLIEFANQENFELERLTVDLDFARLD